jgi:hypothetical protein
MMVRPAPQVEEIAAVATALSGLETQIAPGQQQQAQSKQAETIYSSTGSTPYK